MCSRFVSLLLIASSLFIEGVAEPTLALEDALAEALENNLDLAINHFGPANAQDDLVAAESQFDWELFSSAELNERQAAAASSSLDSAPAPESGNRRLRAGAEKELSTGGRVTLDTGINRSASNNNAARNPDYVSDVGVRLRQPLWGGAWGEVNLASVARAKVSQKRSLFTLKGQVLDVLADTELSYLELMHARAARDLILSSIEQASSLLEENQERERLGIAIPLEVLQAETILTERQEDLIQADRRIADAIDALFFVLGREQQEVTHEGLSLSPFPTVLPILNTMEDVVEQAVAADLDASVQERVIEQEKIDQILAEDAVRPKLDLVGGLRYSGRDSDGPDSFRGAYRQDGYSWNAGLEFRIPWGNRGSRARVRQAERAVEAAELTLVQLKREKALSARAAWRAVESGRAQIVVAGKALELSEATFEQEYARYQSGAVPYRNVLEAQRELDAARDRKLRVRANSFRALVRLSRIDGSILERHGYTWDLAGAITTGPSSKEESKS